jgi:hypothetical protein
MNFHSFALFLFPVATESTEEIAFVPVISAATSMYNAPRRIFSNQEVPSCVSPNVLFFLCLCLPGFS